MTSCIMPCVPRYLPECINERLTLPSTTPSNWVHQREGQGSECWHLCFRLINDCADHATGELYDLLSYSFDSD